jgi:hypothetical protein
MTINNSHQKNFIASLFDFGFTSFVTLRFLKVIYTIIVVLILLGGLAFLIAGLSTGTSLGIIGAIIFAPLITLVYLILARIAFEVIAMFFRIGDNTFMVVQLLRGAQPGQWNPGAPTGYGQPSGYGPPAGYGPPTSYGAPAGYGTQAVPDPPWSAGSGGSEPAAGAGTEQQYGAPPATYGQPQEGPSGQSDQQEDPPTPPAQQGWGPTPPTK